MPMLPAQTEAGEKKRGRGPTKHPRICAHAEILGVTRTHLWQVLESRRQSPPLIRRFNALRRLETERSRAATPALPRSKPKPKTA